MTLSKVASIFDIVGSILEAAEHQKEFDAQLQRSLNYDQDPVATTLAKWLECHSPGDYRAVTETVQILTDRCQEVQNYLKIAPQGSDRDALLKKWREQIKIGQSMNQRVNKLLSLKVECTPIKEADSSELINKQQQMQDSSRIIVSDTVVEMAETRDGMKKVQKDAADLAEIYLDMKHLTEKQGDVLQAIEKNTAKVGERATEGVEALKKAEERSVRRPCCGLKAILLASLVIISVIIVLVILAKPR